MDNNFNVGFINSVASGKGIPCPQCNTLNSPGATFCGNCGKVLGLDFENDIFESFLNENANLNSNVTEKTTAFPSNYPIETTHETSEPSIENYYNQNNITAEVISEPISEFAKGLPSWDIVPPQIMVRRKSKK